MARVDPHNNTSTDSISMSLRCVPAALARQNTEAGYLLERGAHEVDDTIDEAVEISSLTGKRT